MEKAAYFQFHIEGMTQSDADVLWDKILEGAEALGHPTAVVGTYDIVTQDRLVEIYAVKEK